MSAERERRELILDAKSQAAVIVEQATQRAHHIEEAAKADAIAAAEQLKKAAEADIQSQYLKAQGELKSQLADMIVSGVEKVIDVKLDAAKDQALIEKVIAEVAA